MPLFLPSQLSSFAFSLEDLLLPLPQQVPAAEGVMEAEEAHHHSRRFDCLEVEEEAGSPPAEVAVEVLAVARSDLEVVAEARRRPYYMSRSWCRRMWKWQVGFTDSQALLQVVDSSRD